MRWQELKNNAELRLKLQKRAEILGKIRDFFKSRGYLETNTPLLVKDGGLEPHLNLFETAVSQENGVVWPAYLITSPEYSLKKLLAAGFGKIFQLDKCFRDAEPWNQSHNPEFTLLEWYRTGANYKDLMDEAEELIKSLLPAASNFKDDFLNYQGQKIDLKSSWERLSVREAWQRFAGCDLNEFLTHDTMRALVLQKGYTAGADDRWDDLFFKIFLTKVEPPIARLGRPVFLYDYPAQMAALSRLKKDDPRYAERFELYCGGLELANGYGELLDAGEQRKRFEGEIKLRRGLGKKIPEIDEDFLTALREKIPECSGIALGVDRLVMLLTDSKDISEVIFLTFNEQFKMSE
ncbi:MAG: EF-P lysine aminoacylase GenX [Candidatus Magasanikbacteria bacterium]|nr:EF-P lysine aminoacylase GenX [Candidatus Magasanikbacteria bacterium]